jgi:hypothetical protein
VPACRTLVELEKIVTSVADLARSQEVLTPRPPSHHHLAARSATDQPEESLTSQKGGSSAQTDGIDRIPGFRGAAGTGSTATDPHLRAPRITRKVLAKTLVVGCTIDLRRRGGAHELTHVPKDRTGA